jgi:hypothetical protein
MGSLLFGMTGLKKAHVKTSEASFLTKVILPELRVQSLRSKFMVQSQTALGCGLSTASKSKRSRLAKGGRQRSPALAVAPAGRLHHPAGPSLDGFCGASFVLLIPSELVCSFIDVILGTQFDER